MAHTYSYLYKLPTTGLRFFTVYGPWGRPDMALFKFTKNILDEKPIDVFNNGKHTRDFTYIDDIVKGVIKTLDNPATIDLEWNSDQPDPASSKAPWRIYNIGNSKPIQLLDYINALESVLNKKAKINLLPLQPGDVPDTYANVENLNIRFNYKPSTSIIDGVSNFVKWYKSYYEV
jgi:UDP-glucuronate 4-epimerase